MACSSTAACSKATAHAITCSDNGRNGMTFRKRRAEGRHGHRLGDCHIRRADAENGNAGIETQGARPLHEAYDLNISQTYFVENKGRAFNAVRGSCWPTAAASRTTPDAGIKMANEGRMYACRASTYGRNPICVNAVFKGGSHGPWMAAASRATAVRG